MNKAMKRTLYFALSALALASDSYLSIRLAGRPRAISATVPVEAEDPLQSFRLEREQLRAREEAQLNQIIYSAGAGEDAAQARQRLMDMLSRAEEESTLEGILLARGFEDAVVNVSAHSADVLLRRDSPLTQRESAVILELVMRQTGLAGGNVKIVPVK